MSGEGRPPILCVVGKKHVGKTTTVVRLSAELTRRGHRVMILKHGSHTFSLDPAGTDTYRHYHEGNAARVAMASPDKFALVARWEEEVAPEVIVDQYLADADLVLAEGYKRSSLPKLEVVRRAVFPSSLWEEGSLPANTCLAMASDIVIPGFTGRSFSLEAPDWVERCAEWIERTFITRTSQRVLMRPHLRTLAGLTLFGLGACRPAAHTTPTPVVASGPRPAGAAVAAPRTALRTRADSLLGDPGFRSAHWGVLIVDSERGDTLYSRNAGKLFMPASNMKLITGAVALARLGGDFRYETRVLGGPTVRAGVLAGDLAVLGGGDPTYSDSLAGGDAMAPLRALADSLAARGIREVTGRLLRAAPVFPDSTLGFGWSWDDLDYGYSAPIDALLFNEGVARVTIVGGASAGAPVTVRTAPARTVPALGTLVVTTVARDTARATARAAGANAVTPVRSRVEWRSDVRGTRPTLSLDGQVVVGDSVTLEVALRHPSGAWLDAFAEALSARGIRVRGGVEPNAFADTTGMVTLTSRTSPPLREILPRFEKPSQNQIGELLFKTLGRVETGSGTADSGRAVVERQLLAWGADSAGFAIRDGSGLSRHDYLTPETIVRVLDTMRRHPAFRTYYDALPIAGVDGTIRNRMRGTRAQGNVHAKTGTLDKARALSGYVTTADGRLLLFSMLANNHVVSNAEVERVQDALLTWLATTAIGAPR